MGVSGLWWFLFPQSGNRVSMGVNEPLATTIIHHSSSFATQLPLKVSKLAPAVAEITLQDAAFGFWVPCTEEWLKFHSNSTEPMRSMSERGWATISGLESPTWIHIHGKPKRLAQSREENSNTAKGWTSREICKLYREQLDRDKFFKQSPPWHTNRSGQVRPLRPNSLELRNEVHTHQVPRLPRPQERHLTCTKRRTCQAKPLRRPWSSTNYSRGRNRRGWGLQKQHQTSTPMLQALANCFSFFLGGMGTSI